MIIHYKNGTTNFDGMDNIITPICISCTNERELNGIWIAELLIIKDNQLRFKEIELNDYIKIPTPSGEQLFRIRYIDDTAKHAIRLECKHIFFDLEDRIVWDTFIQDRNGQQALEQVLNNLDETTPFTAFSNISNRNNLRLVRTKGVTSILGGSSKENYLIERYKAELDIDNFNIKLLDRIGLDRGYQIREGKNLTGFEYSEDSTSMCTRILPVLFDGVTIPEKYIDSPLISKYPHVYSNIIKFDDIKLKEKDADGNFDPEDLGFETEEAMYVEARKRCLDLFEKERIDRVKINAAVNFIDLKKTEQYKDLEFIQRLDLGDTVEFIIESYKVTAKERVIRYVYNSLLEDYEEIEIGRESDSFFKGMDEIKNTIDDYLPLSNGLNSKFDDWYNKVIKDVTSQIQTGMKDSYVLVRENEILIMDTTDISTSQKVWRWNRGGLGFSSNGYNGTYTTAMTSNGQFVINEITCQKFVGNLIQADTIQADRLSVEAKKTLREGLVTETNFDVGVEGILATVKNTYSTKKETTDKINDAIKDYKITVDKEFDDVNNAYVDLETEMNGAFKDNIISESEAISINERLVALEKEKEDIYKEYNTIYSNSNLNDTTEKTELLNAKSSLDIAYLELKNIILGAIEDSKIIASEITNINAKTDIYNKASSTYREKFTSAIDKIGSVKVNVVNSKTETLKESFTEFKQSSEEIQMNIIKSGGQNLIKNSVFDSDDIRFWNSWGSPTLLVVADNSIGFRNSLKMTITGQSQGITQRVEKLIVGETYTISCMGFSQGGLCGVMVSNKGQWGGTIFAGAQNVWERMSFTFIAREPETDIYFGTINENCKAGVFWLSGTQITKGTMVLPWSSHGNEIYGANYKADGTGFKGTYEDGTYTSMGKYGFVWFDQNNMSHPYHSLVKTGIFNLTHYGDGNWTRVKIQLPNYFKGKYFEVQCAIAGFETGSLGISILTALVESYNIAEGWFIIKVYGTNANSDYFNNINITWITVA